MVKRTPLTALATAFCASLLQSATAQDCSFSIGPDTTLCNGQVILLQAPAGALNWTWNNGSQAVFVSTDTSGTYTCTALFPELGDDLVVNGDFSQGSSNFTSDLSPGAGGPFGLLSFESSYAVVANGNLAHNNFANCPDHTTGTGNMLVVNGSDVPGANIWCQTVTVQPNTFYAFTAWVATMVAEAPAVMRFAINGVDLGAPLLASSGTCEWDEFNALWNSGTATSATICINNQNLAKSGNDFALDDISFAPLCSFSDTMEVVILPPAPSVIIGPDTALCPTASAVLTASLVPEGWPLTDVQFLWDSGETSTSLPVIGPGVHEVSVQGRCLNTSAIMVIEPDTCSSELSMPNVFTPNGDGINDGFGPILIQGTPTNYSLEIWNRWGQLVFSSTQPNRLWDGRHDGGRVPAGTYFWVARYTLTDDANNAVKYDETGHVTLLDAQ
jgi:gliding motility-associated-like protein